MDTELLRQELRTKRRALQETRIQMSRYGIGAPVNLITDEKDLAADVRAIERQLGIEQTPTIQERRQSAPAPRYDVPTPTPEPVFRERIAGQQTAARQSDIEHQMKLLAIHRRNMAHYRDQARAFGSIALAPPMTRNGMDEQRDAISRIKQTLHGYGVEIEDLSGDE